MVLYDPTSSQEPNQAVSRSSLFQSPRPWDIIRHVNSPYPCSGADIENSLGFREWGLMKLVVPA
jgi:hypothetical protein